MVEKIVIDYRVEDIDGQPGDLVVSNISENDPYFGHYKAIMDQFTEAMKQRAKDGRGQRGRLEITFD